MVSCKETLCLIAALTNTTISDCAAALARLITSQLVLGNPDVTYVYAPGFIWSIVEPSVGIICTCLPTMRVLLSYLVPDSVRHLLRLSNAKFSNDYSVEVAWPSASTYNEINNTLGGESLHNNSIALALRSTEENVSRKGISVLKDVEMQG